MKSVRKSLYPILLLFASAASAQSIDPAKLGAHIKVLSSDAFEGRGPGTPGEAKTIAYIADQFKADGLEPAGDSGGWTQAVTLRSFQPVGEVMTSVTVAGQVRPLKWLDEIVVRTLLPIPHVSVKDAPLVFVGYGVSAPERHWDDFKGVDLHGKIAVVLVNDPDFELKPGDPLFGRFDGKAETYYGRWTYKYEEMARRGAAGVLIVHETAPAAYGWATVRNSNSNPQFDVVRDDPAQAHTPVEGWIQRDVAVELFKAAGLDFEAERARARTEAFTPVALTGETFSADYDVTSATVVTHNVIGKLVGKTHPNEEKVRSLSEAFSQPGARAPLSFSLPIVATEAYIRPMAVAARVNPKDYFSAGDWGRLSARSSWKGLALVAHCWAVIALATYVGLRWPITLPLAVMVIGARQLGLAILMHDAAHGALHPNLRVNDWVADYLCGGPVEAYRKYHLQHHKFAQQAEDPDLVLSAPFPIGRSSFWRKVARDLTGRTWFKQRFGRLTSKLKARETGEPLLPILLAEARRQRHWLIFNGLAIAGFTVAGYWWGWFALWLLPRATWFQLVTRLRNIAEHALVAKDEPDPLRHARSTRANWLERALIAPYWVQYHGEHHLFMHMPCWSLPRAGRLLERSGVKARMETAPGYLAVIRMAAPVAA